MGLKRVILPILGIDMESAIVERWLKAEGDPVAKDEPILLVETDKASTEIVAPADGVVSRILQPAGTTVPVKETLAILEVEGAGDVTPGVEEWRLQPGEGRRPLASSGATPAEASTPRDGMVAEAQPPGAGSLRASPAARKAARELGVDLSQVPGTGPSGRIQGDDVRSFAASHGTDPFHSLSPIPYPPAQSSALSPQSLPGRLVSLGKKRRITAERMSLSARTVARLTLNLEIDAGEMMLARERLLPVYQEQAGVRLSYNDFLVKAVAIALKEHPYLNARWTDLGIYLVEPVNVGVAMAVEDGLVVPVVHDGDRKTLLEISSDLGRLLERAREDRLALEDITGGTFTITNLGMFGIGSFTPIVNPPEAAILGVGRIVEKPVGRSGQIMLRPMMGLSLSFDHRILDGAPAAQFLQRVQRLLEQPDLLI